MVREAGLEVRIFHILYSNHSILALFLQKTKKQVSFRLLLFNNSIAVWVKYVVSLKGESDHEIRV